VAAPAPARVSMLWEIGRWTVTGLLVLLFLSVALFHVLALPPDDPLFQMLGNPRWLHDLRALRQQIDPRQPYGKQLVLWVYRFVGYLWRSIRGAALAPASVAALAGRAHGPTQWSPTRPTPRAPGGTAGRPGLGVVRAG